MTSITTRAGKGSPLTHNEVDANFTNLNNDKLDTAGIALGSAASPTLKFTGDANTGIYSPGADQLAVATNGSGRLFVDSSGRVLAGSSSSLNFGGVQFALQVTTGTGTPARGQLISYFQADANGPFLVLAKSRSNTLGTHAYPNSGDNLGTLAFGGSNEASARFDSYSSITSFASETWGAAARGSELRFNTTSNGSTAITERLRIDSSGNVGIGTTSPATTLDVAGSATVGRGASSGYQHLYFVDERENISARFARISKNYDTPCELKLFSSTSSVPAPICFNTTLTSESARIDSSGRLLVGTSTSRSNFFNVSGINHLLQVETSNYYAQSLVSNGGTVATGAAILTLARSRGTTAGSYTVVSSGDSLGRLSFQGADGTDFVVAAEIACQVDGTPGANDMPGRLVFSTNAGGAATPTERLRITSAGNVGINTTSPTTLLDVNADTVRVRTARTPASAAATGATGEICWDANYIYVCTATNTWRRTAISSW